MREESRQKPQPCSTKQHKTWSVQSLWSFSPPSLPALKRRGERIRGDMKHFREKQTNIGFSGESET